MGATWSVGLAQSISLILTIWSFSVGAALPFHSTLSNLDMAMCSSFYQVLSWEWATDMRVSSVIKC